MPAPRARRAAASVRLAVPVLALALCLLRGVCFTGGRLVGAAPLRGTAPRRAEAKEQDSDNTGAAASAFAGGVAGMLAGGPAIAFVGAAVAGAGGLLLGQASSVPKKVFDPTKEAGAMAPFGYWDPAGLMKKAIEGGDAYAWEWESESTFVQYRRAELKHGRLAMVALTGMLGASFFRFPNEESVYAADGLRALSSEAAGGVGIIFVMASFLEIQQGNKDYDDPAGLRDRLQMGADFDMYSTDLKNKELAHGRLAMSAVLSLWLCELLGGSTPSSYLREQLSPSLLVGIFGLLLVWSQKGEQQMPVFASPSKQARLSPPAVEKEAAKPLPAKDAGEA